VKTVLFRMEEVLKKAEENMNVLLSYVGYI
jgi:hypothetical protein